ncbi:hypothetical protein LCGC14_2800450, partial [marine sediment metagenome]
MTADSNQLQTPRLISIRAQYARSDKFMFASDSLEGFPALIRNAPAFSTVGNPLAGKADFSDTSSVGLLDPDGMIADNLVNNYYLKNSEAVFSIGFAGLATSQYLQIRRLWIEGWQIGEGVVELSFFDMQARVIAEEIPAVNE